MRVKFIFWVGLEVLLNKRGALIRKNINSKLVDSF